MKKADVCEVGGWMFGGEAVWYVICGAGESWGMNWGEETCWVAGRESVVCEVKCEIWGEGEDRGTNWGEETCWMTGGEGGYAI